MDWGNWGFCFEFNVCGVFFLHYVPISGKCADNMILVLKNGIMTLNIHFVLIRTNLIRTPGSDLPYVGELNRKLTIVIENEM